MTLTPDLHNPVLGLGPWWSSALTSGFGLRCAVVAAVGALVLAAALRAGWALGHARGLKPARRGVRERLNDERGSATVEFVLVFVPALTVCLILLQTVLAFSGNLFVHYAAFVATRSAIVEIPNGQREGGGSLSDDSPAFDRAQRAAAFALAPVSGQLSADGGDPVAFEAGLEAYFAEYGQETPAWVTTRAADRLAYAQAHTDLSLYLTRMTDDGEIELDRLSPDPFLDAGDRSPVTASYGPKDPVTVGVNHKLHLSIPYASLLFADGQHSTRGGQTAYALVSATSTMTLEGYDVNLPALPDVEREQ